MLGRIKYQHKTTLKLVTLLIIVKFGYYSSSPIIEGSLKHNIRNKGLNITPKEVNRAILWNWNVYKVNFQIVKKFDSLKFV